LAVVTDEEVDDSEEEDDDAGMDVDKVKDAKKEKTLGKKRTSKEQDEDEETEKPKKKAKGAEGKAISEQPKEKTKALVKDSPPAAKSGKLAAADIDGISKPKKRKASLVAGSESALTLASSSASKPPKKSSTTTDLADAADLPSSKETKRKRKGVKSAAIVDPAPPIHETPEADAQSTARRKKPQQEAFDQQVPEHHVSSQVIPTIDEAIADPPQKKRKPRTSIAEPKVLKSKEPDTPKKSKAAVAATTPPRAYSPSVPVVTDELGDKEKKPKRKDKKAKSADEELKSTTDIGPADVSLSKAELKLKRSAGVGEKKKDKVVKAKGGKSVKDGITGKKVAQG
jgi:ribosome biogenesis protein UTP30